MTSRRLIVNADDFGMSEGVNAGVIRAHVEGIVTSASLMVRRPAAADAVALARSHPHLALGLHLDLGEWRAEDGEWRLHDRVVDTDDAEEVAREIDRQVALFFALVDAPPTHLDSHQHVHRREPALSPVRSHAAQLGVPLREHDRRVRYCGGFYGQWGTGEPLPEAITVEALCHLIAGLPTGATELGCHPGEDPELDSPYGRERAREVEALCDPRVRATIERLGAELVSFAALQPGGA